MLARRDVRRAARGAAARRDEPRPDRLVGHARRRLAVLRRDADRPQHAPASGACACCSSRERDALSNFAQRESELARLNERLVEDSRRDALTGMRNRWALADDLPRLDAVREERGESFAIALCDIDHFKAYNDRFGHLAGDQALRAVSATVRGALRAGDRLPFRRRGAPACASGCHRRQALAAAERVRAAVHEAAMPHVDGVGGVLTVSIGVAAGLATPRSSSPAPTLRCMRRRAPDATGPLPSSG